MKKKINKIEIEHMIVLKIEKHRKNKGFKRKMSIKINAFSTGYKQNVEKCGKNHLIVEK